MKKLLTITIAIMLFVSMLPKVQAATVFSDISTHWAKDTIQAAVQKGYVNGYPDHTFQPDKKVTRAEFIKLVAVALKLPIHSNPIEEWYKSYVRAAVQAGIHHTSDFNSDYNKDIPRLEMMRIAIRAAEDALRSTTVKKQDNELVMETVKKGIINGVGSGNLDLQGLTTRAQAVTVIERILQVRAGGALPADKEAVKNAQRAMFVFKVPGNEVFNQSNILDLVSKEYFDVANNQLVYKDPKYNLFNYKLDTKLNPDINRQVYELTKVLVSNNGYILSKFVNIPNDPRVAVGLYTNFGYEQNNYFHFQYIFHEKNPYDAQFDSRQKLFSDHVPVTLYLGTLWKYGDSTKPQDFGWSIVDYENKLRASLMVLFGQDTGLQIYEFVLNRYMDARQNQDTVAQYTTKKFGNIQVDFVYEGHGLLYFNFTNLK